jgi:hypothetical protein
MSARCWSFIRRLRWALSRPSARNDVAAGNTAKDAAEDNFPAAGLTTARRQAAPRIGRWDRAGHQEFQTQLLRITFGSGSVVWPT